MSTRSAIHDFDFLAGTWRTQQRRLKARLCGCTDWEHFSATSRVMALPGGVANFDTLVAEDWRPGWVGMTLRVYNPLTDLWSIYWLTNEGGGIDPATSQLSPPVVGRFEGPEGIFEGEEPIDGRLVRVRFLWQRLGPGRARWQQAFSVDGGQSWEVNWVMEFERSDAPGIAGPLRVPAADIACNVVELRRYTLHPGQRETLIELFDREFVETQEAQGLAVMGQYRDPQAPDQFVWLRGFADRARRVQGLTAFYGGPVWQQHRSAANATMVDSDDVLLLRPAWPGAGLPMQGRVRAAGPVRASLPGRVALLVCPLREPAGAELLAFAREVMAPCWQHAGAEVLGWYVTDPTPNDFPRLPVREDVTVLVGLARFDDAAAYEAFHQGGTWAHEVQPGLARWLAGPATLQGLVPSARSAVQAAEAAPAITPA